MFDSAFHQPTLKRRGRPRLRLISLVPVAVMLLSLIQAPLANADHPVCGIWVYGAIDNEYQIRGGQNVYGCPTIAESAAANGGKFQVFQNSASFYWRSDVGAHEVGGRIRDKWRDFGWEAGTLGYPSTSESDAVGGKFNHFQGGSIYWSSNTDAHELGGAIQDKYASLGWERSPLNFPTSDEFSAGGGVGRGNSFQGGTIYWSAKTGAHKVWGNILTQWAAAGYENSYYGFPISDEVTTPAGWSQDFERGTIGSLKNGPGSYNPNAAISYADQFTSTDPNANPRNTAFPDLSGSSPGGDCSNFVSQVLNAGGLPTTNGTNPAGATNRGQPNLWFYYDVPGTGRSTSYSWGGEPNLFDYLTHANVNGVTNGTVVGSTNAQADILAPYAPFGVQKGDLLFFNWGTGEGISHVKVVAGVGKPTDNSGLSYNTATVIDSHTTNRQHGLWSGGTANPDWRTTTVYSVQISPHS